jgi:pilus assembly protein CpaF
MSNPSDTPEFLHPAERQGTTPPSWGNPPSDDVGNGEFFTTPGTWTAPPGIGPDAEISSPAPSAHPAAGDIAAAVPPLVLSVADAHPVGDAAAALDSLFVDDRGTQRLLAMLRDPGVQDIRCNGHDRIFFTDGTGPKMVADRLFPGPAQYEAAIDQLLAMTDAGYHHLADARTAIVEGSFRADRTDLKGSIFIATPDVTRGEPALVVRKQPTSLITLDHMLEQGMMSTDMRLFLELAVRGRLNLLISGGSGAGKTTMTRALSWFIDPSQRVVTVEEIDELHLRDRLPNVVSLTSFRETDGNGKVLREDSLDDLVRHALRMRADRIWVGETRGKEALALVKSCLSGHDGSATTLHANNAAQAVRQLVSYVMEGHLTEEVARDQVSQAFHIAIQISQVKLGRRVITEIVELENVREGTEQRRNDLWRYDFATGTFVRTGTPTSRLRHAMERYNVNLAELDMLAAEQNSW